MSEQIQDPHKRLIAIEDEMTELVRQLDVVERIEAELTKNK